MTGKPCALIIAQNTREIGHRSETKSAIERLKKIVLVARQYVRSQSAHRLHESCTRIGKSDAENREIHRRDIRRRKKRRPSAGIDVNAFSIRFDKECEGLAAFPSEARRGDVLLFGLPGNGTPIGKTRSCMAAKTRIFHGPTWRESPGATVSHRVPEAPAASAISTAVCDDNKRAPVRFMMNGTSKR